APNSSALDTVVIIHLDFTGEVDDHLFPDGPAETVCKVMNLVHDNVAQAGKGVRVRVQHVAEDFGGHDDDGRLAVDGGVAGEEANVGRAVLFRELRELLVA